MWLDVPQTTVSSVASIALLDYVLLRGNYVPTCTIVKKFHALSFATCVTCVLDHVRGLLSGQVGEQHSMTSEITVYEKDLVDHHKHIGDVRPRHRVSSLPKRIGSQ